ncbi:hypothetical protein GGX14DRAFT_556717 [Mycena pura]|uniref:Uncharacterized protein n=1 Tax=Mycena pura TaxID=153505 RepID=A0AAD7E3X9_9AGAR|nr:hypothetical protein GGX14DRAFT_556717 [Mycena pura]
MCSSILGIVVTLFAVFLLKFVDKKQPVPTSVPKPVLEAASTSGRQGRKRRKEQAHKRRKQQAQQEMDKAQQEMDEEHEREKDLQRMFDTFIQKQNLPTRTEFDNKFDNMHAELNKTKGYFRDIFRPVLAPIYTSLLVKGMASFMFWHQDGLYPPQTILTVAQLGRLNDMLEQEPEWNRLAAARLMYAALPHGPGPRPRDYDTRPFGNAFPGIKDNFRDLRGNDALQSELLPDGDPDKKPRNPDDDITLGKLDILEKKYAEVVNRRNRAAHEANAIEIANFLAVIEENRVPRELRNDTTFCDSQGYWVSDFRLLRRYYRYLFGFEYSDAHEQTKEDQELILSNSGSLDTIVVDDLDEDTEKA